MAEKTSGRACITARSEEIFSREKVIALVDLGLRSSRGSYKNMAAMFRLKQKDYRRFMDFLRRNDCLLDCRLIAKPRMTLPMIDVVAVIIRGRIRFS